MKLFRTKGYRTFMNFVYGWGAAAVIIGALFKIMHFSGAGIVLTIGMFVEATIFFLSAFEPAMEHYDWARVFPQLGKNSWDDSTMKQELTTENSIRPGMGVAGLERQEVENLRKGIRKFTETAESFSSIALQAPEVNRKMSQFVGTFDRLNDQTRQVGDTLESTSRELTSGCSEFSRILSDSVKKMALEIEGNFGKMQKGIIQSTEEFDSLRKLLEEQNRQLKSDSQAYSQSISIVTRHVSALNTLYELQIQQVGEGVELYRKTNGESLGMLQHLRDGRENVFLFKQQSEKLADRVTSLNEVYGNMLSLVNNN